MVTRRLLIVFLMSQVFASVRAWGEDRRPELVAIPSGEATLHAHVWRPAGRGPFPAILVNHGSGRTREQLERLGPYEGQSETLGPVFARHGYVCVFLFRRGVGPSTDQGESAVDAMDREGAAHGQSARNALQMELLEGRELADARAALAFVRRLPDVDARRVAIVGHSFGGSLSVLMTEREPDIARSRRLLRRWLQLGPFAGAPRPSPRRRASNRRPAFLPPRRERLFDQFGQVARR